MRFPFFDSKKHHPREHSDDDLITNGNHSNLSEALKATRTNIMYSLSDIDGGKCVMVTSAVAAEGKTTNCINLAVSLAQTEARVLLVDADMRCPRVHTYLKIKNQVGLSNYLGGFASLDEAILKLTDLNVSCITAGALPPNPAELLSSKKMTSFINTVSKEYDYIIFDTPPVNIVSDTITLARLVEHAVLICKCGFSVTTEIKKAIAALKFTNTKILGFISIDSEKKKKKKREKGYSRYYYAES